MIRNVVIMSTSGIVLFTKEFAQGVEHPRLVGSLLTAMLDFSTRLTSAPITYIELTHVAVSIVGVSLAGAAGGSAAAPGGSGGGGGSGSGSEARLYCALVHDRDDGAEFGRLIAQQVLHAFVETYGGGGAGGGPSKLAGGLGHNLKDFDGFHFKIAEVLRNAVKPVLALLQQQRGVQAALLVTDEKVAHAVGGDVDQLGLVANLQAVLSVASDLMAAVGDSPQELWLDVSRTARVLVFCMPAERATLVLQCRKAVPHARSEAAIASALHLLRRVCRLGAALHAAR
jgi:hypothetical protein